MYFMNINITSTLSFLFVLPGNGEELNLSMKLYEV